jgi:CBS domain-containing protein
MKSVKSILGTRETTTVERLTSILDAARLMADRQVGAVPVIDEGRLVGIFSERDVLTRVVAAGRDPSATLVGDVMSTDLIVADVSENHQTCLSRMQQAHVRHIIALENGRLAGIISLRDVLAAELDEKDDELTMLNAYVHYIPAHFSEVKGSKV